jgi:hypothetical protein
VQVSLQPTYSLANNKINPKHSISNSAHYNQTLQYNIHYTNSQQFETVLNYRIIGIVYGKWEKFSSSFRCSIHQRSGKYIVTNYICQRAVCRTENIYMKRLNGENVVTLHLCCSLSAKPPKQIQIPLYTVCLFPDLSNGYEHFDG